MPSRLPKRYYCPECGSFSLRVIEHVDYRGDTTTKMSEAVKSVCTCDECDGAMANGVNLVYIQLQV